MRKKKTALNILVEKHAKFNCQPENSRPTIVASQGERKKKKRRKVRKSKHGPTCKFDDDDDDVDDGWPTTMTTILTTFFLFFCFGVNDDGDEKVNEEKHRWQISVPAAGGDAPEKNRIASRWTHKWQKQHQPASAAAANKCFRIKFLTVTHICHVCR